MLPLYIICALSLLVMLALVISKMIELSGKKYHIKFSKPEWDWHILKRYNNIKHNLLHIKRESLANFFHRMAKVLELLFIRLADKLEKRFSRLGDMIRGKHTVVRKKSSVSFFLKNIEEHKKHL